MQINNIIMCTFIKITKLKIEISSSHEFKYGDQNITGVSKKL